jgi:tellurite resistance protein TerC
MTVETPAKPKLVRRLEAQRETIKEKPRALRWLLVAAGFTLLLAGAVMLVLPGPAFVVIPIGLALLSLEFCWAGRLLDRSLVEADKARRKAAETTWTQRILTGGAVVLAIGAVIGLWSYFGDVPVLPAV